MRYQVTGTHPFLGHPPGSTFEAELPPDQEARAVTRGSIRRVRPKRARSNRKETS